MSIRRDPRTTQAGALIAAVVAAAMAPSPEAVAAQPNPVPIAEDGTGFGDQTNYAPEEQRDAAI